MGRLATLFLFKGNISLKKKVAHLFLNRQTSNTRNSANQESSVHCKGEGSRFMGGIGGVEGGVVVHQHELPDIEQQLQFTDVALYAQVPGKARVDCQIDDDSLRSSAAE
jgi:hypothetical protein